VNLVLDYEAIGFDVDHCLVKYDTGKLNKLITDTYLKELHTTFGYPKQVMILD
jgi:hypothetical protein